MNLDLSPADKEFREEARTWLEENVPRDPPPADLAELREYDLEWQRRQYEAGWAGISWPVERGGKGLSLIRQLIWYEVAAMLGAPEIGSCFVGMNHAGPTLIACASPEQQTQFLPPILRGEVVWCQGFSEPEAGSDLASLRTRGVVDGDEIIVNGQKIWTSYAQIADFQELLIRTGEPDTRHKGLTWIVCDMRAPGITVRPIKNVHGGEHFGEIFYDNVRIPVTNVVGRIGEGWSVAMSTLAFERGTAAIAHQIALAKTIEELVDYAHSAIGPDGHRPAIADDEIGRGLALLRAEAASLRAMTYRIVSRAQRSGQPGPEGSMIRLFWAELAQRTMRIAYDIEKANPARNHEHTGYSRWTYAYLDSIRMTVGAGTKDIQRNIIGERVLGLARGR